jgi:hypothetical protein
MSRPSGRCLRRDRSAVRHAAAAERLESRRLLAFSVGVNFQPAGSAVPAGYVPDSGLTYANRGNGFTYGWNADNSVNTRDKDSSLSPDQPYDTLEHKN